MSILFSEFLPSKPGVDLACAKSLWKNFRPEVLAPVVETVSYSWMLVKEAGRSVRPSLNVI